MKKESITTFVACPTCGKDVPFVPESKSRPFCSERCRMIDLGTWFNEENAIPGEEIPQSGDANTDNR